MGNPLDAYHRHPNSEKGRRCSVLRLSHAAYIAGLFDGEGSVSIISRHREKRGYKNPQFSLYISVTNTNREVLEWLEKTTGMGSVYLASKELGNRRNAWRWQCGGKWHVARLLKYLAPHLIIKRERVNLILCNLDNLGRAFPDFKAMNKRGTVRGSPVQSE